jgi:ABC-type Mn2+/Zn2+ transport system ATPase subunit
MANDKSAIQSLASQHTIQVEGLNVSYDRKRVLSAVYLTLDPGNVYGLLGPNGAGKSTLFKAILELIDIDTGRILIKGGSVLDIRKEVVYVPQRDDVDFSFPATVYDVVRMGRFPHVHWLRRFGKSDQLAVDEALEKLGIAHLRERQIGQLSGGQQQRVFLARALAQEADIWFLDEPFVGVDATTEGNIMELLHSLADEGKTIVVIHHDLSTVESYFDKVILLNQRIVAFGDTKEIFNEQRIAETFGSQTAIQHRTNLL